MDCPGKLIRSTVADFINDDAEPLQSAYVDQMVPDDSRVYISQIMTLLPGDVVLTGTPLAWDRCTVARPG